MRAIFNLAAAGATAAAFIAAVSLPATAACKRYGFTVNDYGKDGPTKDAKALLDKTIASKMSELGVKDYRTGKKSVSCELFLNFIVFDEHTCTAEATVCWGGSQLPKSDETAAADDAADAAPQKAAVNDSESAAAKKKGVANKSESGAEKKKTATAKTIADPKKPVEHAQHTSAPSAASTNAAAATPEAASSETEAAPVEAAAKPEHASHSAKPVETGSLNEAAKKPAHHNVEKAAPEASDGPPVKLDSGAGYPTPEAPQDGAQ